MRDASVDFSPEIENDREHWDPDAVRVDSVDGSQGSAATPSIGRYLAMQRELRGISRKELCDQTHIPLRSLERLEAGIFDSLNDGFVRGFVRTVADALGLDLDDTLARMSREPTSPKYSPRVLAGAGLMRLGALVAGLSLVLISVGLVGVAVQLVPGRDDASPLVMRTDPVRALAEAGGVSSFSATQALVQPTPQRLPQATSAPEASDSPQLLQTGSRGAARGESVRADAHTAEP